MLQSMDKDPSLDKDAMQDRYIPGAKISDIYAAFLLGNSPPDEIQELITAINAVISSHPMLMRYGVASRSQPRWTQ